MTEEKNNESSSEIFGKLLDEKVVKTPKAGDTVKGKVLAASKAEVKIDIDGVMIGVVRGRELYQESDEYGKLKPGDETEATVIDEENENGEVELSFRFAGQEKAWATLRDSLENRKIIKIKITDANKGGLIAHFAQIFGFIPVSQLAPENYPRINGGDKTKIFDKLRSFVGKEMEVKVITLEEKDEKVIFSEKEAWNELQKDVISKYKVGTVVEGMITAVTDFGVFISFDENLEGLIHISELAWQRIDDPSDLYKVGGTIKAEVISVEGSKIFLSAKKLIKDPWEDVAEKYKIGQIVTGQILKVNPFGLFVKLDDDIHALAHISQLGLAPGQKITDLFKSDQEQAFAVVSIEAKDHRLGLKAVSMEEAGKKAKKKEEAEEDETKEAKKKASKKSTEKEDDEEEPKKKKTKKKED